MFESHAFYIPCRLICPETLIITCCDHLKVKKLTLNIILSLSKRIEKVSWKSLKLSIMFTSSCLNSEPLGGQVCVSVKVMSPLSRPYKTLK